MEDPLLLGNSYCHELFFPVAYVTSLALNRKSLETTADAVVDL
jgi:hypothetical protein